MVINPETTARKRNRRNSLAVIVLAIISFSQSSSCSNTPHRAFAAYATTDKGTTNPPTSIGATSPVTLSKSYDIYIIVTPFGNSISRAVTEELLKQLSEGETRKPNHETSSAICFVRCPPITKEIPNKGKFCRSLQLYQKLKRICYRFNNNRRDGKGEDSDEIWLGRFSAESPIPILSSGSETTTDTDLCFDPFGCPTNIRKSAEDCLNQIRTQLFQRMTSEAMMQKKDIASANPSKPNNPGINCNSCDDDRLSIAVNIRGILFNPFGCSPSNNSESIRQQRPSPLSPLAEYKLVSVAIFLDVALSTTRTRHELLLRDFSPFQDNGQTIYPLFTGCNFRTSISHSDKKYSSGKDGIMADQTNQQTPTQPGPEEISSSISPPRIILVGTEAARGLPKMGIPVPDLEGSTESSIKNKIFLSARKSRDASFDHWEINYAEMNALAVLYFKALGSLSKRPSRSSSSPTDRPATITETTAVAISSSSASDVYFGVVSPGMTEESFKITNVPEYARTMAFRWKLWLCGRRWVFDRLKRSRIAKTSAEAGFLLAKALLNGPWNASDDTGFEEGAGGGFVVPKKSDTVWDDVYPSGSFVGARSGTGGPLCEQSLLVYNATSNSVGLTADAVPPEPTEVAEAVGVCSETGIDSSSSSSSDKGTPTETLEAAIHGHLNFLGNRRLQELVYRVVREIIADGDATD